MLQRSTGNGTLSILMQSPLQTMWRRPTNVLINPQTSDRASGRRIPLFRASHRLPGSYPKTGVISELADYTTATRIEMQSINEDKDS
jgi:hypothetical protein